MQESYASAARTHVNLLNSFAIAQYIYCVPIWETNTPIPWWTFGIAFTTERISTIQWDLPSKSTRFSPRTETLYGSCLSQLSSLSSFHNVICIPPEKSCFHYRSAFVRGYCSSNTDEKMCKHSSLPPIKSIDKWQGIRKTWRPAIKQH